MGEELFVSPPIFLYYLDMKILVTGGAGYIGSITVKKLIELKYKVVVADSLERGNKWAIDKKAKFFKGDLLNKKFVKKVFTQKFDGIIHFAGYIAANESVKKPNLYFKNNLNSLLNVLEAAEFSGSNNLVFSSSAGVYGNPKKIPIEENSLCLPVNPYGETKLIAEQILKWHKINFVVLRYFNVAGALLDASLGEAHKPETHIIPLAIEKAEKGGEFLLFGDDYPTPSGSCIRDYIHVLDLAEAHILALKSLWNKKKLLPAYNVGTGNGYSNKQVIKMIEKVSGKKIKVRIEKRREGDPAVLVADNSLIKKHLGFKPRYSDLKTIIETAYNWHKKFSKK